MIGIIHINKSSLESLMIFKSIKSSWVQNVKDLLLKQSHSCGSSIQEGEKIRQGKVRGIVKIPLAPVYCLKSGNALDRILSSSPLNEKILWKSKCLTCRELSLDIYKMMPSSTITWQPFVKSHAVYFSYFYRLEIYMNRFLNSNSWFPSLIYSYWQ